MNYTIVTGFFDINREKWNDCYTRTNNEYFRNFERVCQLDDSMVVYISEKYIPLVSRYRKKYIHKTRIIVMNFEDLPYYNLKDQFQSIMSCPSFKNKLKEPNCPEVTKPEYDIIMFSKTHLVKQSILNNYFNTTHHVWVDFGLNPKMLRESMLNKPLFTNIPNELSFLCISPPKQSDLHIEQFYKSHTVRLCGTVFSGSNENLIKLDEYVKKEVNECLKHKVIDYDQSLFTVSYLKHQEIFRLYYGNWDQMLTNYYKVIENKEYVLNMLIESKGDDRIFQDILDYLKK